MVRSIGDNGKDWREQTHLLVLRNLSSSDCQLLLQASVLVFQAIHTPGCFVESSRCVGDLTTRIAFLALHRLQHALQLRPTSSTSEVFR